MRRLALLLCLLASPAFAGQISPPPPVAAPVCTGGQVVIGYPTPGTPLVCGGVLASGSVANGTVGQVGVYSGVNAISPLTNVTDSVLVRIGTGNPALSTSLPPGLTIPGYAPLDTPTFIGVPSGPTAATTTNTTQLATTAYVKSQGYLTGNATITLSGAVSGSGTSAITTALGAGVVSGTNLAAGAVAASLGYTPVSTATQILTTAPLAGGGDLSSGKTLTMTGPSNVTTFSTGAIPRGTGTTPFIPSTLSDSGSGVLIGSPIGGAQGPGTLNADNLFVKGVAVGTGTGGNFAPIDSPVFTGNPTGPTPATADNDTSLATTAFVKSQSYISGNQPITLSGPVTGSGTTAITTVIGPAAVAASNLTPGAAVGNIGYVPPPNTLTLTTSSPLTGGGDLSANRTLGVTGPSNLSSFTANAIPKGASTSPFTPSSLADTGAGVTVGAPTGGALGLGSINAQSLFINGQTVGTGLAPLNSPVFTGDPRAPTPATADNDTSVATTAYVQAQGYIAGNQTITLSGPITGSGSTAITTTVGAGAILGSNLAVGAATTNLGFTPPPNTRAVNTTAPLAGGGDLSADRTLSLSGPANLTTLTANAIPKGAGTSPLVASSIADAGAGITVGGATPQGAGTINVPTGLFVNGVSVSTGSGSSITGLNIGELGIAASATSLASSVPFATTGANKVLRLDATGKIDPTVIPATAVTPGSCTNCNLSITQDGRVTSQTNGSGGSGANISGMTPGEVPIAATSTTITSSTPVNLTGSSTIVKTNVGGTIDPGLIGPATIGSQHLAPGAAVGNLGFTPIPSSLLIATSAPLAGGGDLSANRTLSMTGPSNLTSFTANMIPKGTDTGPFASSSITDTGAGVMIGAPFGGAKGNNSLNASALYVGGVPVSTSTAVITGLNVGELGIAGTPNSLTSSIGYATSGPNKILQLAADGTINPAVIPPTTVTPGSCTNCNLTIGQDGRIALMASGTDVGISQLTGDVATLSGSGPQVATVQGWRGRAVSPAVPSDLDVMIWSQTNNRWEPAHTPFNAINQLTGDVTTVGAVSGSAPVTLATVNSTPGTFAVANYDAKGRAIQTGNLTGDVTTSAATASLVPTGVTAGSYNVTGGGGSPFCWAVDTKGRITGITAGACAGLVAVIATGTHVAIGTGTLTAIRTQ